MINQNPFRVLGISLTASEREIQKQITKTIRFAEVGKKISFDTDFSFIGEFKRDKESISIASSAIEQPINRLLHSLFWFWNANHIDAAAFDNLSKDNTDRAIEIWEKVVKDGDVSTKNLSCLFNLKSLYVAQSLKDNSLDSKLFITGILLAGKFLNHSELDSYTKQIVGDHVNVSSEELEIKYITSIYSTVKPFLKKNSGITTDDFLSGFATFSKKSREHISTKFTGDPIKKIEDQINTTSELREQNPIEALSFGETLYKNTKPQLESLFKILGHEDLKYQMLANKLANEILQCGIDYFNKLREEDQAEDEDGKKVLKLCKLAKKMVSGFESPTNARIDENYQIISDWVNDSSRELIAAFNKAMGVYENFISSIKSVRSNRGIAIRSNNINNFFQDYEDSRVSSSCTTINLIEAGYELIKFTQEASDRHRLEVQKVNALEDTTLDGSFSEASEEFLSFSDNAAKLLIAMVIEYSNNIYNSEDSCIKLLQKTKLLSMEKKTRSRLFNNLGIIKKNVDFDKTVPVAKDSDAEIFSHLRGDGDCFIATMVYGDYEHPQVLVLREFRDNFLAHYALGKSFIRFYYKYSPGWVKALEHNKMINKSIEKALNTFIKIYQ